MIDIARETTEGMIAKNAQPRRSAALFDDR
jgi:hypothetical protein